MIVDGDAGVVIVDPDAGGAGGVPRSARRKLDARAQEAEAAAEDAGASRSTAPTIELLANIELPEDCAAALEAGATGIGLFRSEFLFMGRTGYANRLPTRTSSSRRTARR